MMMLTPKTAVLFLTLLVLPALSHFSFQIPIVNGTVVTIRLDEMEGWPGSSSFGIWDGGHLELSFNISASDLTSGSLNLHLYARTQGYGWAYVENLQFNGYYLSKHRAFAGSYYGLEKDDWIEWAITHEQVRIGENHLVIDLYLSHHDSDEREDFVVYGTSYLEFQKDQEDTQSDSRPNGFNLPNISPIVLLFIGLVAFTGFIFIVMPDRRMEIVIAIVAELLTGLIFYFLLA